jgi:hypothetical protein
MINVKDIVKGHYKEFNNKIQNIKDELTDKRLDICRACPLGIQTSLGLKCNKNLWINPETEEISTYSRSGYVRGCGCRLSAKATLKDSHCIINKW